MPYFDRFDIAEAYLAMEWDYNVSGILQERPSNKRRRMSTDYQIRTRMKYDLGRMFNGFKSLSLNAKEIYWNLQDRYKFPGEILITEVEDTVDGEVVPAIIIRDEMILKDCGDSALYMLVESLASAGFKHHPTKTEWEFVRRATEQDKQSFVAKLKDEEHWKVAYESEHGLEDDVLNIQES